MVAGAGDKQGSRTGAAGEGIDGHKKLQLVS